MSDQNWRQEITAEDYWGHRQKAANVADRRPVIRSAQDLVGPGIDAQAVTILDFNDLLATYNGYYSAAVGTPSAPNATDAFVGQTMMDSVIGGVQTFVGMTSGKKYRRMFHRNPSDPETIYWDAWTDESLIGTPIGTPMHWPGAIVPAGWFEEDGSAKSTTTYAALFAVLGYQYGGSGGTFNLRDMRDRAPYGVGSEWGLGTTDGLAYGSRERILLHKHAITAVVDHTHNISIESAHTHTIQIESAHTHGVSPIAASVSTDTTTTGGGKRITSGENHDHGGTTIAGGAHSHGGNTGAQGAHAHGSNTGAGGGHDHGALTGDPSVTNAVTLPGMGGKWIIRYA